MNTDLLILVILTVYLVLGSIIWAFISTVIYDTNAKTGKLLTHQKHWLITLSILVAPGIILLWLPASLALLLSKKVTG